MFVSKYKVCAIAFFGTLFFFIFGLCLIATRSVYWQQQVPAELWGSDDFSIGQYFFNHDEKQGGAYDITKARFFYERAIVNDPTNNTQLWYQSGRIDFINGDFDSALEKFAKQKEYFGDTVPNVYYMTGLTHAYKARQTAKLEEWKYAEDDFKKAVDFFYESPWPYVDLAWIYFAQGKFAEMKPLLEKGLSYEANNPWLLNMYGLALYNTNEKELANEYFLFAREMAEKLTVEDWGASYPGNNPVLWEEGLTEFQSLINKNVALPE